MKFNILPILKLGEIMSKNKVEIVGIDTSKLISIKSSKSLELIKQYRESHCQDILDELVNGNLKLVLSIVNKYNKKSESANDLFQIGTLGLLKAIENFDINLDVQFSTYAVPMIDGEIRRHLRDSSMLRISRQIKDTAYHIMKFKEKYMNLYGKAPSNEEISSELEITNFQIQEALDSNMPLSSLSEPLYNDFDQSIQLQDVISDPNNTSDKIIIKLSIEQGLDSLSQIERDIIKQRYYEGKSQVEIAEFYKISQAQVSRLEKSALSSLKKFLI